MAWIIHGLFPSWSKIFLSLSSQLAVGSPSLPCSRYQGYSSWDNSWSFTCTCAKVKNEWSCMAAFLVCRHVIQRDFLSCCASEVPN